MNSLPKIIDRELSKEKNLERRMFDLNNKVYNLQRELNNLKQSNKQLRSQNNNLRLQNNNLNVNFKKFKEDIQSTAGCIVGKCNKRNI